MINLLPPAEKEKVHGDLLKKQINSLGLLVVTILAGSSIFILNTVIFLKIQTRELKQSLSAEALDVETQKAESLGETIKNINLAAGRYQHFRSGEVSMFEVFSWLQEVVPARATLRAVTVDAAEKKIVVGGTAQSRGDVVLMESRLKKSRYFEKVESPLANFLEKNNANFSFVFYLKPRP